MLKQPRRILILEDDAGTRRLFRRVLEGAGFLVEEAEAVEDALVLAKEKIPHAVLIDLLLGAESGLTYLAEHRKSAALRNVPVIVVSGINEGQLLREARARGAADFVAKPIEPALLIQRIRRVLRESPTLSVQITDTALAHLSARVTGTIAMASEVGFLLEVPVRLAADSRISVSSPLMRILGLEGCLLQRSRLPSRAGSTDIGMYLNEIAVFGIGPSTAHRVRERLQTWR